MYTALKGILLSVTEIERQALYEMHLNKKTSLVQAVLHLKCGYHRVPKINEVRKIPLGILKRLMTTKYLRNRVLPPSGGKQNSIPLKKVTKFVVKSRNPDSLMSIVQKYKSK